MIKEGKFTLLEKRGAVAQITINRPEKRNALSRDAIREILSLFEELRNDDSIAVVLTTGAGDVAYCAGRDLSEFRHVPRVIFEHVSKAAAHRARRLQNALVIPVRKARTG